LIYEFLNGTDEQKRLWAEAIDHFLTLPKDALPLSLEIQFVDPSELPSGHTDLAATTYSYGSSNSSTVVRNDAPGFGNQRQTLEALAQSMGLEFSVEKFYMETAAHELGHALYAALSEEKRVQIAEMFGATSDSPEELQPEGTDWRDHISEGIAETFKEAFLPRRYRVFPNRTNKRIPYHQFPEFRSLWRQAVPAIEAPGGYDLNIFEIDGFSSGKWVDPRGGLYSGTDPAGIIQFSSESRLQFGGEPIEVEGGHKFDLEWTIPAAMFLLAGSIQNVFRLGFEAKLGAIILARWELTITWTEEEGSFIVGIEKLEGFKSIINPPSLSGANPTFTLKNSFVTPWEPAEKFLFEILCFAKMILLEDIGDGPFGSGFVTPFRASIPDFRFRTGGGGAGGTIVLPESSITPQGFLRGSRPRRRAIMGTSR